MAPKVQTISFKNLKVERFEHFERGFDPQKTGGVGGKSSNENRSSSAPKSLGPLVCHHLCKHGANSVLVLAFRSNLEHAERTTAKTIKTTSNK